MKYIDNGYFTKKGLKKGIELLEQDKGYFKAMIESWCLSEKESMINEWSTESMNFMEWYKSHGAQCFETIELLEKGEN